jgi:hypothetical protein
MRESNSSDEEEDGWRQDSDDVDSDEEYEDDAEIEGDTRGGSSTARKNRQTPTKKRQQQKKPRTDKGKAPKRQESPTASESDSKDPTQAPRSRRNREGNLYDAVAGRLGAEGFLGDNNRGLKPLRPDEVLYSRAGAPVRYEEDDEYTQHRHLPPDALPSSDLLKAIHAYVSDYYGSGHLGETSFDFESMDETALIAFGILLEETAASILGETGDLAFTEALPEEEEA